MQKNQKIDYSEFVPTILEILKVREVSTGEITRLTGLSNRYVLNLLDSIEASGALLYEYRVGYMLWYGLLDK